MVASSLTGLLSVLSAAEETPSPEKWFLGAHSTCDCQKGKWSLPYAGKDGGCTCFSSRAGVPWETWSQCRDKTGGFQWRSKSFIARVHIILWAGWYHPFLKKWDCQILCCLPRQAASFGIECTEMILCNQQSVEDTFMKSYDCTNRTDKVVFFKLINRGGVGQRSLWMSHILNVCRKWCEGWRRKTGCADGRDDGCLAAGFLKAVTVLKDLSHFIWRPPEPILIFPSFAHDWFDLPWFIWKWWWQWWSSNHPENDSKSAYGKKCSYLSFLHAIYTDPVF